jgi:transposase-like protein
MKPISFARHRFPPAVIQQAVWLDLRFTLSYRDIEDLMAERGLDISDETVRRWVAKLGPLFARELRQRRPRPTERWHMDGMVVRIAGQRLWLWRAVDDEGEVLDLLVPSRRNTAAAVRLVRKILRKQGFAPHLIVIDKLRSYATAIRQVGLSARHGQGQRRNNLAREFPSADPPARAKDAALQISGIRPAVPVRSRRGPQHLHHRTPLALPQNAEAVPSRSHGAMARRDRGRCVNTTPGVSPCAFDRLP